MLGSRSHNYLNVYSSNLILFERRGNAVGTEGWLNRKIRKCLRKLRRFKSDPTGDTLRPRDSNRCIEVQNTAWAYNLEQSEVAPDLEHFLFGESKMKLKIGDIVKVKQGNARFKITQLPGYSKMYPNDYQGQDVSDGQFGLFNEEQVELVTPEEPNNIGILGYGSNSLGGIKHDSDKVDLSLMPIGPQMEVARVWTFGKKKYSAWNWTNGFVWSRPYAAALRHIFAWASGQDKDPETGLSHLAHAVCCLQMLLEFQEQGTGQDDRFKTYKQENK